MRPQTVSTPGGAADSAILCPDANRNPFSVSLVAIVTGTVSYSIQHSYDNPQLGASNMRWFSQTALTTQTASKEGTYTFPVRALRISQASGAGTVELIVLQAGHGPGG